MWEGSVAHTQRGCKIANHSNAQQSRAQPTHSSSAGSSAGRCRRSSLAAAGGSRTDHSTPVRSSAGVAASWCAAEGTPLAAAPDGPNTAPPPAASPPALPPASWPSMCCRAALLERSSLLRPCWCRCCCAPSLPAWLHAWLPACPLLLAKMLPLAAAADGRWREASADTVRQRCCLPLRSDCSTHRGDTMPTPATERANEEQSCKSIQFSSSKQNQWPPHHVALVEAKCRPKYADKQHEFSVRPTHGQPLQSCLWLAHHVRHAAAQSAALGNSPASLL